MRRLPPAGLTTKWVLMIHDASTDDWERRQRAQAAPFDAIGARYDEAFPHRRIPRIRVD